MKNELLSVLSNNRIAPDVYELKLGGAGDIPKAGQFVELAVNGFYLRRPFGVADFSDGVLTLLYRVQGRGTEAMTSVKNGDKCDVLAFLGNGFDINKYESPLLIGGGMGAAPLYYLAKIFKKKGITTSIILGSKSREDMFYADKFEKLGNLYITTDDGSFGYNGNVVQRLKEGDVYFDGYYACGPLVMLKNLKDFSAKGVMSLEARMGCGFGACMG